MAAKVISLAFAALVLAVAGFFLLFGDHVPEWLNERNIEEFCAKNGMRPYRLRAEDLCQPTDPQAGTVGHVYCTSRPPGEPRCPGGPPAP